jgi:hypothetical protein
VSPNCTTVDVKDLHRSSLISCDTQLAVPTDLSARCRFLESRDGLDDSIRFRSVYLQTGAGGDDVAMRGGRGEVDMGDGCVGLEEDGRLQVEEEKEDVVGQLKGRARAHSVASKLTLKLRQ